MYNIVNQLWDLLQLASKLFNNSSPKKPMYKKIILG